MRADNSEVEYILRSTFFEIAFKINYFEFSACADNRKFGYTSNRVFNADFSFYMGKAGITSKDCLEWTNIYDQR